MPTLDTSYLIEWVCLQCSAVWQAARKLDCSYCGSHDVEPTPSDEEETR